MNILIISLLVAQILNPLTSIQVYTTADPNNPDRLGLATPDGRYSITPIQDCQGIADGQNILIYPAYQLPPWLVTSALDGSPEGGCIVRVEGRMSDIPCFTNEVGMCDIHIEYEPTE